MVDMGGILYAIFVPVPKIPEPFIDRCAGTCFGGIGELHMQRETANRIAGAKTSCGRRKDGDIYRMTPAPGAITGDQGDSISSRSDKAGSRVLRRARSGWLDIGRDSSKIPGPTCRGIAGQIIKSDK